MRKSAVVIGILALVVAGGVFLAGPVQAQCAHAAKAATEKAAAEQAGKKPCCPSSGVEKADAAEKKTGCGGSPVAKVEGKAGCGGCAGSAEKKAGCGGSPVAKVEGKAGCGGCAGTTGLGGCASKAHAHGEGGGHDCVLDKGLKGTFGPAPDVRGVTQKAYPIANGLVIVHQGADARAIRVARRAAQEKVGTFQATCASKKAAQSDMCGGGLSKLGLLKQAKAEVVETEDGAIVVITSSQAEAITFLHAVIAQFNERLAQASA